MKPLKILVVDDQPINLKLLKAQLEAEGHTVIEATNGAEGLTVLEGHEVDLIVSDILMPVMDGYRFCYEVRRHERFRELPFIIHTSSYISPSDEKLSLDLGADKYLRKPAAAAHMMQAIEESLSSPHRQPTTTLDGADVLKEYSERLVAKLEQKNSDLERAVSQLVLQSTALKTIADAAIITDADGVILWVNTAFTTTTGYTAEEAIGKTPRILKSGLHGEEFYRELWKTIRGGHPWRSEFANRRKDGSIYYDEHTVTPVHGADGSITHFVGVMHDITERKRAEEELRASITDRTRAEERLRELNIELEDRVEERTRQLAAVNHQLELRTNELAAANVELSAASTLKDEFLANMSHELRTPLNAILGMSEVLAEGIHGALNDRQQKSLKTIEESARHLLELINDILDLSKIEAGKLEVVIAPVGVRALCDASVRMVRELAVKKRLRLSTTIDPRLVTLTGDDRRLKQILVNLLSNAVKFTPEGGAVGLDVISSAEENVVSFSVWDTGIGISAAGIDQLFRPFVQLDSTYARQFAGTGLGLSLVRRMTQLHGGRVDVESAVGQGSRFTVTIPWRHPIAAAEPLAIPEPAASPMPERDSLIALVIEDDIATAEQITRYLRTIGFAVVIHDGGAHATSLAAVHNPAVIILDIMLEGESGWNILGELKAGPETRHIPVIVASVVDDGPRGRALGAADYVVKPVSYADLAAAVGRVVPSVRNHEPVPAPRKSGVILLAEDNASNIEVMRDFIGSRGYSMVVAMDGFEAVERAVECLPALIFMDIQMPRLDGFEAIRRIRQHSLLEKTPIVALTAFAMEGDREKCLAAGADDYMTKPVSLKTISEVLKRFVEPSGQ